MSIFWLAGWLEATSDDKCDVLDWRSFVFGRLAQVSLQARQINTSSLPEVVVEFADYALAS
jgi:hypothetical protein